ncbi:MAG: efflux RND transporter periplasmic adaptor subunit [Myxococcota bacterium]
MQIGRRARAGLVAAVVATAGVGGWIAFDAPEVTPAQATSAPPPAPVVTAVVTEQRLTDERRYLGEVKAVARTELTVGEAGEVAQVLVAEGDAVTPGQLLLTLDDRLARAQLGEADAMRRSIEVRRAYAAGRTERFRALERDGAVSAGEIERERVEADRLAAERRAARAGMAALSERVGRHRIEAPFAGVIARRYVDPGDWLDPGEPALEVVSSDQVEVHVRVPERLLDDLEAVARVSLVRGDERVNARVDGVVQALDTGTRTALLRLVPASRPEWLRPGAATTAAFDVVREGGLGVSRDALVRGVASERVVRVVDGKAVATPVEVLVRAGERALVRGEGLDLGAVVVVRGNERLRPGQSVQTEEVTTNPAALPSGTAAPRSPE